MSDEPEPTEQQSQSRTLVTFHFRGGFGPNSDYRMKMPVTELPDEFLAELPKRLHPSHPELLLIGTPERRALINMTHVAWVDLVTLDELKRAAAVAAPRGQQELIKTA